MLIIKFFKDFFLKKELAQEVKEELTERQKLENSFDEYKHKVANVANSDAFQFMKEYCLALIETNRDEIEKLVNDKDKEKDRALKLEISFARKFIEHFEGMHKLIQEQGEIEEMFYEQEKAEKAKEDEEKMAFENKSVND